MIRMSVSTETASFALDGASAVDSEFAREDLIETDAVGETEDYQLRAARRAQLEDADTLRRMRAL
jgi:hypothetical protein